MNIFVVDQNPFVAARSLCNSHVIKMILESCLLLSTHDRLNGLTDDRYKTTHVSHPCRKCLSNEANRIWLRHHLYGLCKEYTFRFGKTHKCQLLLERHWLTPDLESFWSGEKSFERECSDLIKATSFPQCMPKEFRNNSSDILDVVQSYRRYYRFKKESLKKWKYSERQEPEWLEDRNVSVI